MDFLKYSRLNNMVGWAVFLIALITYTSTQEATVSLWDCGEFIPASYKLEVVHPPGAPFFLMLNHFFTIVAKVAGNDALASTMVNFSSALMSALTILFLFWTITALAAKMTFSKGENGKALVKFDQAIAVLGSGVVGALAYTWSDTFWFSAVEGEVYAMSSMFIALVSWLMMKWEARADQRDNMKWLVLISFFIGLSSGVHLMSLLAIPAMTVVFYYRKYTNHSWRGLIVAAIIGVILLGLVQVGVVTGIPTIMAKVELLFVNDFGMPFWSGVFTFLVLLIGLFVFGIYWTFKKGKQLLHVGIVCAAVIFVGYSSYAMVVIRSLANPAIDMNDPEDVFSLLSYLNREQYGDRPILKGPNFDAYSDQNGDGYPDGIERMIEIGDVYRKGKDRYEFVDKKRDYEYRESHMTFFPRMYSNQDDHKEAYYRWTEMRNGEKPTMGENMKFFRRYQLGHMWWRYFGWNFIGRQNDIQGHGSKLRGNFITGITFIDNALLGIPNGDKLPDGFKNDKSRNALYGLPFLLGLFGFFFQIRKDRNSFFYTLIYFGMTGIALTVYLNMPPYQPRERDYVFVGSFYFFSVWIGLGVLMIYDWLRTKINPSTAAIAVSAVCLIAVPIKMVAEEWDDHDRSNRKVPLAFGRNYLESCPQDAILFTNGDNDTYPLWYAQEVEGIRPDVRIINLSLLNTDWYTNQMRRPINEADSIDLSLQRSQYVQGKLDYIEWEKSAVDVYNQKSSNKISESAFYDLGSVIKFISSKNHNNMLRTNNGQWVNFLPTRNYKIPISEKDKDLLIENNVIAKEQRDLIVDEIKWKVGKNRLMKADIITLDVIATNAANGWKRPICWAITTGNSVYENLMPYLRMEGLVYRLVPMRRFVVTNNTLRKFQNSANNLRKRIDNLKQNPGKNAQAIANLEQEMSDLYRVGNGLYSFVGKMFYTEKEFRAAIEPAIGARLVERLYDRIFLSVESNDIPGMAGFVGSDIMFNNVTEKFEWGGLESEEDMWVDYVMMRSARNLRTVFSRLAQSLADEADKEEELMKGVDSLGNGVLPELKTFSPDEKRKRAIAALDKGMESIPQRTVPYSYLYMWNEMTMFSDLYYRLGEVDKAYELDNKLAAELLAEMEYFASFKGEYAGEGKALFDQNKRSLQAMISNAKAHGKDVSQWQAKLQEIQGGGNSNAPNNDALPQMPNELNEGGGDEDNADDDNS